MSRRLVIDLGSHRRKNVFLKDDLILITKKPYHSNEIQINFHSIVRMSEPAEEVNAFFDSLPKEFMFLKNEFYAGFYRPFRSLVHQIDELIANEKIERITLIGGSSFKFFGLRNGLGEGGPRYFSNELMLNYLLNAHYGDKVNVEWVHKDFVTKAIFFQLSRVTYEFLQFLKFFVINLNSQRLTRIQEIGLSDLVCISDSSIKTRLLRKLVLRGQDYHLIAPKYNEIDSDPLLIGYAFRIIDFFLALGVVMKSFSILKSKYKFKNGLILLSKGVFVFATITEIFNYDTRKRALKRTLKKILNVNPKLQVISNSTFGTDMVIIRDATKELGVELKNYQTVSFTSVCYPDMELADEYYLYDKSSWNFYSNLSHSYHYYLPDISYNRRNVGNPDKLSEVVVFSQPDDLADYFIDFIRAFTKTEKGIRLILKLHYRQNKLKEFEKLCLEHKNVKIDYDRDASDLLENCDLALSISSAVLQEAVFVGCPGIIYKTGDVALDLMAASSCFAEVNLSIKSPKQLTEIAENYQFWSNQYFKRRAAYYESFS